MMDRIKKITTQVFLVVLLFFLLLDAIPVGWPIHRVVLREVDGVYDRLGLWQGGWKLFAPKPDRVNVRVSAQVHFEDGRQRLWAHPDWSTLGPFARTRYFRWMEYFDDVRLDDNKVAWEGLAKFIAGEVAYEDGGEVSSIKKVELMRSWATIQPPDGKRKQPIAATKYETGVYTFYTWPEEAAPAEKEGGEQPAVVPDPPEGAS